MSLRTVPESQLVDSEEQDLGQMYDSFLAKELALARLELPDLAIDGDGFATDYGLLNEASGRAFDRVMTLEAEAEAILCDPDLFGLEEDECEQYAAMLRDEAEAVRRTIPEETHLAAAPRAAVLQPLARRLAPLRVRRWLPGQRQSRSTHAGSRRSRRRRRPARAPARSDDPHEPVLSRRGAGSWFGGRS